MPNLRCPDCQRILKVDESHRGDTVRCPMCGRPFDVARRAEDDEPLDAGSPYHLKNEPDAPRPFSLSMGDDDRDEDERPIRRRRRRRKTSGLPDFLAQWNLDKVLLVGSVGVWFVLLGLALVQWQFCIVLIAVGAVLLMAGRIWAAFAAMEEGTGYGCLMLFSPYFFWSNLFNLENRRPLFLIGVGAVYMLTGLALLSIFFAHR